MGSGGAVIQLHPVGGDREAGMSWGRRKVMRGGKGRGEEEEGWRVGDRNTETDRERQIEKER